MNSYEKFEELRNSLGIKNYDITKNTGIATATLIAWRNGKYEPKLDKRLAIAKYLGVPLESLIGDENEI